MTPRVWLEPLDRTGLRWAQAQVTAHHYLHAPVDARCSVEGYAVRLAGVGEPVGCLLVGRPEATRCYPWYGSVADVASGRASCTRWQVLNLARVWLDPRVQKGGCYYDPLYLPGVRDWRGKWHSALATTALAQLVARVGVDYLLARPPCFLDEPYPIRWLLSYCDPATHHGTLYRLAGFTYYPVPGATKQTWRIALPALSPAQDAAVRERATWSARSQRYRAARAFTQLPLLAG